MSRLQVLGLAALTALLLLGGCATRPINPPIKEVDANSRVYIPDAAEALQEPGKPRHPRLFRRRHPRRRVLLWGSGVPAAHRGHDPEGQGPPARRRRRDHRRVGRQLHGAGLRPLWRQALRRLRAALPQARRSGRTPRPRTQPGQLGQPGVDGLGPFRTGGPVLRRDPVQRCDLRRPRPRRWSVHHGVDHRHLERRPGRLQPEHLQLAVRGSQCHTSFPCRCSIFCRAGRAVPGHDQQLRRHLQLHRSALGPAVHPIPRIRHGRRRARSAS